MERAESGPLGDSITAVQALHAMAPNWDWIQTLFERNSGDGREAVRAQAERRWERFAGTDLEGRTVLVVGMGRIGREVGRMAQGMGMTVLGIKRTVAGVDPGKPIDESETIRVKTA